MDLEAAGFACGVVDGCGFFKIEGCVKCVDFLFFDFCKWRALLSDIFVSGGL